MCCVSSGAPHRALSRTLWIRCTGEVDDPVMSKVSIRLCAVFLAMATLLVSPVTGVTKSCIEEVRRINAGDMRDGFEDGWRGFVAESWRRYFAPLVSVAREIKACSINLGRAVAGTSSIDDK